MQEQERHQEIRVTQELLDRPDRLELQVLRAMQEQERHQEIRVTQELLDRPDRLELQVL
jgi:hypothetical protein